VVRATWTPGSVPAVVARSRAAPAESSSSPVASSSEDPDTRIVTEPAGALLRTRKTSARPVRAWAPGARVTNGVAPGVWAAAEAGASRASASAAPSTGRVFTSRASAPGGAT
jgi:hypothetical protein